MSIKAIPDYEKQKQKLQCVSYISIYYTCRLPHTHTHLLIRVAHALTHSLMPAKGGRTKNPMFPHKFSQFSIYYVPHDVNSSIYLIIIINGWSFPLKYINMLLVKSSSRLIIPRITYPMHLICNTIKKTEIPIQPLQQHIVNIRIKCNNHCLKTHSPKK